MPRDATTSAFAAVCIAFALLCGCTAPAAQSGASAPAPVSPAPASPGLKPAPIRPAPAVSRACKVDADCAVKDVGSCCGYFPACVAKDARPDPAAVKAQCAASGMASTCGFREIEGCSCVAGTCRDAGSGVQVR